MIFLKCKVCRGEVEIIGNERSIAKKIKCLKCGFHNFEPPTKKEPEIIVRRKCE